MLKIKKSFKYLAFALICILLVQPIHTYAADEHFKTPKQGTQNAGTTTHKSPLSAWKLTYATLNEYGIKSPIDYGIRLEELYWGEEAAEIVATENSANQAPTTDQQWLFMKFYLINREGDTLSASDVVGHSTNRTFYSTQGASIPIIDSAALYGDYRGQDIYDLKLESGASGYFYVGILIAKSYGFPLMKMVNGYDEEKYEEKNYWLSTDPNFTGSASSSEEKEDDSKEKEENSKSEENSKDPTPTPAPTQKDDTSKITPTSDPTPEIDDNDDVEVDKTKITKLAKGNKKFTAKWKKVAGVNGYELQYSTSKYFGGAKTKRFSSRNTSAVIKKLKARKTYYVRIRCFKTVNGTKYYSEWCATKKVKTAK